MSEDQSASEAGRQPRQTEPPVPDEPAAEPEGTGFVQVNRRRAPRYRAFVVTGLVVAFVVAAAVAVVTPPSDGYSQQALFGYLFVSLGVLGSLLGGLVAVLVERRSGRSSSPRR